MEVGKLDQEKFFNFIKEQAKLIREQSLDLNQIQLILNGISNMYHLWITAEGSVPIKNVNLTYESFLELNLSLQIAYSNYRKENKNLWTTIFGFAFSKIPQFDVNQLFNHKQ